MRLLAAVRAFRTFDLIRAEPPHMNFSTLSMSVVPTLSAALSRFPCSRAGSFHSGVVGARAATLSFMVGSDSREAFVRAEELLKLMGSRAIHCGKNGGWSVFASLSL